ncbi:glucose-6-phosphate dehydrogenase assembly protein OpcA [Simkania sp.]|uniref:glucose-6-phosphate dehydrogenase assembly protein OpcA n=1 Tax=Simkania sp. TaxID=34094 RepID=UPI003B51814A
MVETIHPTQIELELDRIWESYQGTNKMRACLFNLIIYSKKCQRVEYLNQVAQNVIEKFPSRIIFITYDDTCSSQDLRTAVSVLTADEGENEIACDMIEIDVCSKDHPRVPFVVLPHILPDLPVYLVHADDPTQDNPIAAKLERFASRIIFDSEAATNLPAFARAVLTHHDRTTADIADLNWARTEGWRQLFANIFKSQDELHHFKHATDIHIHFNSLESVALCHTNVQAIYLQTWFAAQLGWKLTSIAKEKELLTFTYDTDHLPVRIFLHPSKMQEVLPGRILSVEIQTDREIQYSLRRNPNCPSHVLIEKSSPDLCSLPIHFVFDHDIRGQSLVREICHKGTSQHYTNMIKLLSEIKSESLCE